MHSIWSRYTGRANKKEATYKYFSRNATSYVNTVKLLILSEKRNRKQYYHVKITYMGHQGISRDNKPGVAAELPT